MSSEEVNNWMKDYDNPMKPVVQRVREIIMAADERMEVAKREKTRLRRLARVMEVSADGKRVDLMSPFIRTQ